MAEVEVEDFTLKGGSKRGTFLSYLPVEVAVSNEKTNLNSFSPRSYHSTLNSLSSLNTLPRIFGVSVCFASSL
eukprot:scaffold17741_cov67-Cyclotella_meneghiniana.AAC.6